jgi:hypothetical protein
MSSDNSLVSVGLQQNVLIIDENNYNLFGTTGLFLIKQLM